MDSKSEEHHEIKILSMAHQSESELSYRDDSQAVFTQKADLEKIDHKKSVKAGYTKTLKDSQHDIESFKNTSQHFSDTERLLNTKTATFSKIKGKRVQIHQ